MPSFVNSENTPVDYSNAGVVHLNNPHYDDESAFSKDRFAQKGLSTTIDRYVSNASSFDDTSSSGSSGPRVPVNGMNGDRSHTSLSSYPSDNAVGNMKLLPNGRSSKPSLVGLDGTSGLNGDRNGYAPNSNSATERSLPTPTVDGEGPLANGVPVSKSQQPSANMPNSHDERGPLPSSARNSLQQTPVDLQAPNGDISASAATSSLTPDGLQRQPTAPQRYSSPAHYGGSASTPTLQAPPPNALRQRHTLEVPRPQQNNRNSIGKDAPSDGAFTTGRFSPTVGSGGRGPSLSLGRRNTRSIHSEIHRDEVLPDDDAARWTEAYRQKRARRKRRDEEDDDKVLVGTKVDEKHANWETAYNMLTGIRVSVSRTNAKLDRPLTDADFQAKQKSTFDM